LIINRDAPIIYFGAAQRKCGASQKMMDLCPFDLSSRLNSIFYLKKFDNYVIMAIFNYYRDRVKIMKRAILFLINAVQTRRKSDRLATDLECAANPVHQIHETGLHQH
jgi:hypothetical protein